MLSLISSNALKHINNADISKYKSGVRDSGPPPRNTLYSVATERLLYHEALSLALIYRFIAFKKFTQQNQHQSLQRYFTVKFSSKCGQ